MPGKNNTNLGLTAYFDEYYVTLTAYTQVLTRSHTLS